MPLTKPVLDSRSYAQIRDDLVRRIPVYAPEWTDHNVSDPGIALLELFAYLGESVLYRFNQIPETTKLEFLRLLQIPLRPATPARTLVAFTTERPEGVRVALDGVATAGDVGFSIRDEALVLPVEAFAVAKTAAELPEEDSEEGIFYSQAAQALGLDADDALKSDAPATTAPYSVDKVWIDAPGTARDFEKTVDGVLWVAVLALEADAVEATRLALAEHDDAPVLLNIGFMPEIEIEPPGDTTSPAFADRFRCPGPDAAKGGQAVQWEISTGRLEGDATPVYRPLRTLGDTSRGLERTGVVRVELPADAAAMAPFALDNPNLAGAGDLPPPLDDEQEERLLFWLRAFRLDGTRFGRVLYVGANAARVEQTVLARPESLGLGDGQPGQVMALNNKQIVKGSLTLEVEEDGRWQAWTEVEHFSASQESDRHFVLDAEAGLVRFGTGLEGYVPQVGQRVRVRRYRYGGGAVGNVAAKAISKLRPARQVKVENPFPARGGADAETVAEGLERIPGELRRRDRAVTSGDFRELALQTPGARIGRADVLPLYHPSLPDRESAGVVGVIIWPKEYARNPSAPLPDTEQVRMVCNWLDARRLVTTELYVMPPKYRPLAIAAGVRVKPGYGIDAVRHWVELVLRQYLAPLPPYGPSGGGWPLGRRVLAAELFAAAHHVEGVEYLEGLELAGWNDDGQEVRGLVELARNEVPELVGITVENGPVTVDPGTLLTPAPNPLPPVPIPVLRETC